LTLSHLLTDELRALGLKDVTVDEFGYVMATVPSNTVENKPVIGFLAHVDTSPDMPGNNVKPRFIENYDGDDIQLNPDVSIAVKDFPEITAYKGQTLIVTDGTTLLGADDKAGIAEIMTAVDYMVSHPEFCHGDVRIGFTVDEEVGRGVDRFDVAGFNADFAYTLDGGRIGELEYENFNAAGAKIVVQGRNIHPGYAKNKMKNALLIGQEFDALLPADERPDNTDGYEGFYHLIKFEGTVEKAIFQYIIRDHDKEIFENRKQTMKHIADKLNKKYGENTLQLELFDQYFNMREQIEPVYHIVETAVQAMSAVGVTPIIKPIRGGTDGARLSFMGLPCPNLFAGGENFHGKHEYIPVESMVKACEVMLKIIEMYSQ
jgi:tripeptide aminopeptidase